MARQDVGDRNLQRPLHQQRQRHCLQCLSRTPEGSRQHLLRADDSEGRSDDPDESGSQSDHGLIRRHEHARQGRCYRHEQQAGDRQCSEYQPGGQTCGLTRPLRRTRSQVLPDERCRSRGEAQCRNEEQHDDARDASARVPNCAATPVSTNPPSVRVDCSMEAGRAMLVASAMSLRSILKSSARKRMP